MFYVLGAYACKRKALGGVVWGLVGGLYALQCMYLGTSGCWVTYMGTGLHTWVLGYNVDAWLHTWVLGYIVDAGLHTWVLGYIVDAGLHTWVLGYIRGCWVTYMGTGLHTWMLGYIRGYWVTYIGTVHEVNPFPRWSGGVSMRQALPQGGMEACP